MNETLPPVDPGKIYASTRLLHQIAEATRSLSPQTSIAGEVPPFLADRQLTEEPCACRFLRSIPSIPETMARRVQARSKRPYLPSPATNSDPESFPEKRLCSRSTGSTCGSDADASPWSLVPGDSPWGSVVKEITWGSLSEKSAQKVAADPNSTETESDDDDDDGRGDAAFHEAVASIAKHEGSADIYRTFDFVCIGEIRFAPLCNVGSNFVFFLHSGTELPRKSLRKDFRPLNSLQPDPPAILALSYAQSPLSSSNSHSRRELPRPIPLSRSRPSGVSRRSSVLLPRHCVQERPWNGQAPRN